MLKNYFKIAWRSLLNNKVYSAINVLGLAIGMAVALLIGLWIWDEISFDRYHKNHERLAQVMTVQSSNGEIETDEQVAIPLRRELQSKYGDAFANLSLASGNYPHILASNDKKISVKGIWAEPSFPDMLTLKLIQGNRNALKDVSSILISQSVAKALFGDFDPINKTIKVNNQFDFKVAGVFEDLPNNTTLSSMKFLLPWDKYVTSQNWIRNAQDQWGNHSFWTFVELKPGINFTQLNTKIKDIAKPHTDKMDNEEILLHGMDQWHLYSEFDNGKVSGGRIRLIWLFGIIGAFVLLLACINFMNLSTARSERRTKEVGVRKSIGSRRGQLILQFLTESLVVAVLALILAIVFLQLALPWFNTFAGKQLALPWDNPWFWTALIAFTLLVSLLAGSYPAFYLSSFKAIKVLKGNVRVGRFASVPRKVLVVTQFSISIILIIGTLIIYQQIQYTKNRPVGYSREGLISVAINTRDLFGKYHVKRTELLKTGVVESMAESSSPMTDVNSHFNNLTWKGKNPDVALSFGLIAVTHDYGKTIGWEIKEGRDYSKNLATDTGAIVLNEAAVKLTGFKQPVGEIIKWDGEDHEVIGVVKDMVMESPYAPVKPAVFFLEYGWSSVINIRIKPSISMNEALTKISPVFSKFNPGGMFEYHFVDEKFSAKFSDEERIGNLATLFAILAIFISCLGLFGLASFIAMKRSKEVSIRKVLGATIVNLWYLLSREFIALVCISCLLAFPIAWHFLSKWLQKYDYHTEMSLWAFAAAGIGALTITLMTVSYQAIKAALANPVKNLRSE